MAFGRRKIQIVERVIKASGTLDSVSVDWPRIYLADLHALA
jgi:hypothetical protein